MFDSSPSSLNNKANPHPSQTKPIMDQKQSNQESLDMNPIKRSAKRLNFGSYEEKTEAVKEIKRLAMEDARVKRLLAEMGIVSSLVCMLSVAENQSNEDLFMVVEALIELAKGTFRNKVLMVNAGLLAKLAKLMDNKEFSRRKEPFLLLLTISSLAKTNFHCNPHQMLPSLIMSLNSKESEIETKLACLETLYNLSLQLNNIKLIISNDAIETLLTLSLDKITSEESLTVLANIILTTEGKKGIENSPMIPKSFIEIMSWDQNPRCQELSSYLIMVLAYGNKLQRQKMHECGIVQVLLELALLGSPLAQKRAIKILQWFKDEGGVNGRVHSGPRMERVSSLLGFGAEEETGENKKAVKRMVKQSLDRNMESILRRVGNSQDFSSAREKALVASSSSKSLPY
ncbi:hypothetical protein LUZ60_000587 [Juncus effusus]|nr:hypothetical protein LUZ60_000587 [Juncus effusus]